MTPAAPARYVMIGGFLGAGKTTAVDRLARHVVESGRRVGLITNDQSHGLVDTALLRSRGFQVEEITGGCFCCRFPSLQAAALGLDQEARPEVIVAEPVGSCTDLLATVSYPLRRIYGDRFEIAPLSVLIDPARAGRILGLREGKAFSEKVRYVYLKQLEEAEAIVVNKADTLDPSATKELVRVLLDRFPRARCFVLSAKTGKGLEPWFDYVLREKSAERPTIELDYARYAEGEALLGWLNATFVVESSEPFDGNALLLDLTLSLKQRLAGSQSEIAHLKWTLDCGGHTGLLSVVSLVSTDGTPDLRESLVDEVPGGQLVLNLRAEADPEDLAAIVRESFRELPARFSGLTFRCEHEEFFRPAPPVPSHRIHVRSHSAGETS